MKFEVPEITVLHFEAADIIATSGGESGLQATIDINNGSSLGNNDPTTGSNVIWSNTSK